MADQRVTAVYEVVAARALRQLRELNRRAEQLEKTLKNVDNQFTDLGKNKGLDDLIKKFDKLEKKVGKSTDTIDGKLGNIIDSFGAMEVASKKVTRETDKHTAASRRNKRAVDENTKSLQFWWKTINEARSGSKELVEVTKEIARYSFFKSGFKVGAKFFQVWTAIVAAAPALSGALGGIGTMINGLATGITTLGASVGRLAGGLALIPGILGAIGAARLGAQGVMSAIFKPALSGAKEMKDLKSQISDAQRALRVARDTASRGKDTVASQERVAAAQQKVNKLTSKYNKLAKDTPKGAQDLQDALNGVKKSWNDLWRGGGRSDAAIGTALKVMQGAQSFLKGLEPGISRLFSVLQGISLELGDILGSEGFQGWANVTLSKASDTLELIWRIAKNLAPLVGAIYNEMQDFTNSVLLSLYGWSETYDEASKVQGVVAKVHGYFDRSENSINAWVKGLGHFGRAFANIFRAALPTTNKFESDMTSIMERFENWTVKSQPKIERFFQNSYPILQALGRLLVSVFTAFGELSGARGGGINDGKVSKTTDSVVRFLDILGGGIVKFAGYAGASLEKLGPQMNRLWENIGNLLEHTSGPGLQAANTALSMINKMLETSAFLADKIPFFDKILGFILSMRVGLFLFGMTVGNTWAVIVRGLNLVGLSLENLAKASTLAAGSSLGGGGGAGGGYLIPGGPGGKGGGGRFGRWFGRGGKTAVTNSRGTGAMDAMTGVGGGKFGRYGQSGAGAAELLAHGGAPLGSTTANTASTAARMGKYGKFMKGKGGIAGAIIVAGLSLPSIAAASPGRDRQQKTGGLVGSLAGGAAGAASGAAIGAAAGSVVPGIGTAIGAVAGIILGGIGAMFGEQIGRYLGPPIAKVGSMFMSIVKPIVGLGQIVWAFVSGFLSAFQPLWDFLGNIAKWLGGEFMGVLKGWWGTFSTIMGGVASAFKTLGDVLVWLWDHSLGPLIDKIQAVGNAPGNAKKKAKAAGKAVGGALNPFDGDIVPGFRDGGVVPGSTTSPNKDSVMTKLTPGEVVLSRAQTSKLGVAGDSNPFKTLEAHFGLQRSSGDNDAPGVHASGSYHYRPASWGGVQAYDYGDAKNSIAKLSSAAQYAISNPSGFAESFYDKMSSYVDNGKVIGGQFGGHGDHLHWAIASATSALGQLTSPSKKAAKKKTEAEEKAFGLTADGLAGTGKLGNLARRMSKGANEARKDDQKKLKKVKKTVKKVVDNSAAGGALSVGAGDAAAAKAYARAMLASYGWGPDQFGPLDLLWMRESGWNSAALNKSSGATGIPQLNPSGGQKIPEGWQDPRVQVRWGLNYIKGRYGNPANAWAHSQNTGWYAKGGDFIASGAQTIGVGEKGPERVTVQPLSGAGANIPRTPGGGGGAAPVTINSTVNVGVMVGDDNSITKFVDMIGTRFLADLKKASSNTIVDPTRTE